MNSFIENHHYGIEVGSGTGFSKDYIENKNFKTSDISSASHLDFKNIDAQKTGFPDENFDYVIASTYLGLPGTLSLMNCLKGLSVNMFPKVNITKTDITKYRTFRLSILNDKLLIKIITKAGM